MIVGTGKHLTQQQNDHARQLYAMQHGPAIVVSDRGGRWSRHFGVEGPLSEPDIARLRFLELVNGAAVELGLDPPEKFVDEDGDEAVNNYGVNFETREVLFWDRHASKGTE